MKKSAKLCELCERIVRLMESYGLEVSDLEEINGLVENAARARCVLPEELECHPQLVWPVGTERYSLGPNFL